eukprot:GHVU01167902.1.p1 GENE.GHVU01167902.1~~GHVU01167902.1.p1  ORF type:complete len:110 (+),score=7.56 GHVU01167902.1:955-1284(+)
MAVDRARWATDRQTDRRTEQPASCTSDSGDFFAPSSSPSSALAYPHGCRHNSDIDRGREKIDIGGNALPGHSHHATTTAAAAAFVVVKLLKCVCVCVCGTCADHSFQRK